MLLVIKSRLSAGEKVREILLNKFIKKHIKVMEFQSHSWHVCKSTGELEKVFFEGVESKL